MSLTLNLLWRDWKSGHLTLLLISLLVAVGTITSIALFASRIENTIFSEASEVLAGDAQISGSSPLEQAWLDRAESLGLQVSQTISFRAMTFSDQQTQLAAVKAVDDNYPLKGELQWAQQPYGTPRTATAGPSPGEAWLTSRLFAALEIAPGDFIDIGNARFRVSAALIREPDNAQSLFGVAPRVLIHREDVAKTGAVQPGSRIRYRAMFAGDNAAVGRFAQWVEPQLDLHYRWVTVEESNQSIGEALARARYFLYLAGSLGVLLASVAIALAARRYTTQRIPQVALLKTLGLTPQRIRRLYAAQLLCLGLAGVIVGSLAGWLAQGLIAQLLDRLATYLAPPSAGAYGIGAVTGLLCLAGFAAPPFLALSRITPAAVLRQSDTQAVQGVLRPMLLGLAFTFVLIGFYSRSLSMTLYIALGTAICVLAAALLARLLLLLLGKASKLVGPAGKMGLANLHRHRHINTPQIALFGILFMLLFSLILVRTSLLDTWQKQIPADAPNHFVFNIFEGDKAQLRKLFDEAGIASEDFYPMVRGRLAEVEGEPLEQRLQERERDVDYEREFYLTWSDTLAQDNRIVAGQWWGEASAQERLISLEQEFAEGLQVEVGDTLTFSISGEPVEAKVASLRTVQWDSMRPNFFIIFNQPLLQGDVANWITSFYLPPEEKEFVNRLARSLPTLSIIEIDQTLEQVRQIIDRVSSAIQFVWLLVLCAGVLVLITSIQSTLDVRFQEGAVLRTLGAPRSLIRRLLSIEFASIGLLAGLLAVLGSETLAWLLQRQLFDLPYSGHPVLWLVGPLLGLSVILSVGLLSTRQITEASPLEVLRRG